MVTLHTSAQTADTGKRRRSSRPALMLIGALLALALLATLGAIRSQRLSSSPAATSIANPSTASDWRFFEMNTLPEIATGEQPLGGEVDAWQFRERHELPLVTPASPDYGNSDWRFIELNTLLPGMPNETGAGGEREGRGCMGCH